MKGAMVLCQARTAEADLVASSCAPLSVCLARAFLGAAEPSCCPQQPPAAPDPGPARVQGTRVAVQQVQKRQEAHPVSGDPRAPTQLGVPVGRCMKLAMYLMSRGYE